MVMKSLRWGLLCSVGVLVLGFGGSETASAADPAGSAQPLRVLFLGDEGHHRPEDRFRQLQPVMTARGIEMVYTGSLDDLNPARLAGYDCVAIFANHTVIQPAQEKALLDFVKAGGALVAVHCASYCFRNSPRFIELVGAQFERHGGTEFRAEVVAPEHPITRDWPSFTSWDETYVHTKHNAQRTVLAVRREAGQPDESWTWVREVGKGRVFYTASGHDARTWRNPAFHELLTRALRFCARRDVLAEPPAPPFTSMQVDTPVPDYQPGKRTEDQVHQNLMQRPLAPEASLARMVVAPDLRVELFAAEPELRKPIALTFDARGRLFVAETIDYPNNRKDSDGSDRIRVLEDRDGDGRAERFTTFAEGLSVPTSLCWTNAGLVVLQAPDVLLLRDTDGDDRADERRVLFSGWGTGDTHAGPSNLRYAPDNWLWGTVGYSGFNGTVGGEQRALRPGASSASAPTAARTRGHPLQQRTTPGASASATTTSSFALHRQRQPRRAPRPFPTRYYEQRARASPPPGVLPTIADQPPLLPARLLRASDPPGRLPRAATPPPPAAAVYTARAACRTRLLEHAHSAW
jgi:type 1 glutamine amidotransferase